MGQRLIDLEQGWTLDHEGLARFRPCLLHGPIVNESRSHGTRVLGVIAALAPDLERLDVVSHGGCFSAIPGAISCAIEHLATGHVLLVEVMDEEHLPIERLSEVRSAIRDAVERGIVVIEPAGNAGADLETVTDDHGRHVLAVGHPEFEDSGAILVGCCEAGFPGRLVGCNYGSRVDCHEVGEGIATLDSDADGDRCGETGEFGRSSAAAALIAGLVLRLQAAFEAAQGRRLRPAEVRNLLRHPACGVRSALPSRDRIGSRPTLERLLDHLGLAP